MTWPHVTIYTDRLPDGVGGSAHGPVVLIRHKYRLDWGIHAHEQEHVRQWWLVALAVGTVLALVDLRLAPFAAAAHPALYYFVRRYRLWAEARAYRDQMQLPDRMGGFLSLDAAAAKLAAPRYRLDITVDQAKTALQ